MLTKFKQFFCNHEWTSAAQEGVEPTQKQIDDGIKGFYDYATMYCKKCGKISKQSETFRNR